MIPLIAIMLFFLVLVVLVGLIGRRAEHQREADSPPEAPQARH
jgi:hypothetical protein